MRGIDDIDAVDSFLRWWLRSLRDNHARLKLEYAIKPSGSLRMTIRKFETVQEAVTGTLEYVRELREEYE